MNKEIVFHGASWGIHPLVEGFIKTNKQYFIGRILRVRLKKLVKK